eukprot:gene20588-22619_t
MHTLRRAKFSKVERIMREITRLLSERQAKKIAALLTTNLICTIWLIVIATSSNSMALTAFSYISIFDFLCVERIFQLQDVTLNGQIPAMSIGLLVHLVVIYGVNNKAFSQVSSVASTNWLQETMQDFGKNICGLVPNLSKYLIPRMNPYGLLGGFAAMAVLAEVLLIEQRNSSMPDTVCAIFIALSTCVTMFPLSVHSGMMLLQATPTNLIDHLDTLLREANTLEGVLEIRNEHFWNIGFGKVAGSFHVRVSRDADEQMILAKITHRLSPFIHQLTIQTYKDDRSLPPTNYASLIMPPNNPAAINLNSTALPSRGQGFEFEKKLFDIEPRTAHSKKVLRLTLDQVNFSDMKPEELQNARPSAVREMFRNCQHEHRSTSGMCRNFVQANVAVLDAKYAKEFKQFADLNSAPCPLLYQSGVGECQAQVLADNSDIRTDLPAYKIYTADGKKDEVCKDISHLDWKDMVTFYFGCSFTFEERLLSAGIPVRNISQGKNVSMYTTNFSCINVGPFSCQMVVSMRPIPRDMLDETVAQVIQMDFAHGAPVHIGNSKQIGIDDLHPASGIGDTVKFEPGDVPVFWACGVTSSHAVNSAS